MAKSHGRDGGSWLGEEDGRDGARPSITLSTWEIVSDFGFDTLPSQFLFLLDILGRFVYNASGFGTKVKT